MYAVHILLTSLPVRNTPTWKSSKNRQVKGRKEPVMVYEAWFLCQIFSLFQLVVLESLDGNLAI